MSDWYVFVKDMMAGWGICGWEELDENHNVSHVLSPEVSGTEFDEAGVSLDAEFRWEIVD